jgi:hypothetical protein
MLFLQSIVNPWMNSVLTTRLGFKLAFRKIQGINLKSFNSWEKIA